MLAVPGVPGVPGDSIDGPRRGAPVAALAARLDGVDPGPAGPGGPLRGHVKATLLRPAADSLRRVLDRLEAEVPALRKSPTFLGAPCVRLARGSTTSISLHSRGLVIDFAVGGETDRPNDGRWQVGLARLAGYFAAEGWYWGGAGPGAESVQFEVGEQLLDRRVAEGLLAR